MAEILSRGDIINSVAAEVDMPQAKIDAVIKAFESTIARHIQSGDEIRIAGFGTFKTTQRSARTSRNPRTGEPVDVPARTAPSFKAGKALKEAAMASGSSGAKKAPAKADAKSGAKPAAKAEAKSAKAPAKAPAKEKVPTKAELTAAAKTLDKAPNKNKKK